MQQHKTVEDLLRDKDQAAEQRAKEPSRNGDGVPPEHDGHGDSYEPPEDRLAKSNGKPSEQVGTILSTVRPERVNQ